MVKFENKLENEYFRFFSIAVFVTSILCLLKGIKIPNYGGDELWFATPLLYSGLHHSVYSGPMKAIIALPIFDLFGFNIFSVRIFTISVFVLSILAWSFYLLRKRYWVALSATLLIASVNHDLLFFAKVDINQPTFHNMITILYFIVFLNILKSGSKWWSSFFFIILSFAVINNHIRNIWIANAFLFALIVDSYFFEKKPILIFKNLKSLLLEKWPIFVGWLICVSYFVYILVHFDSHPGLEMAKDLGRDVSWSDRFLAAVISFAEYSIGGMVFGHAYAGAIWKVVVVVLGSLLVISSMILFLVLLRCPSEDQWLKRLLVVNFIIMLVILLQYMLTKSAVHPWHGNSLVLFFVIFFGLLLQSLVSIGKKRLFMVALIYAITVMTIINVIASIQITRPDRQHQGFELAVWNLQALDQVRQYIWDNPREYYVADWGIGRPLALESKYHSSDKVKINLELRPLTIGLASELKGNFIIRSTTIGLTVPDYTDEAISRIDSRLSFIVLKSFYDVYGREVYQVGFLRKISNNSTQDGSLYGTKISHQIPI